jgi:hypothetical protein
MSWVQTGAKPMARARKSTTGKSTQISEALGTPGVEIKASSEEMFRQRD